MITGIFSRIARSTALTITFLSIGATQIASTFRLIIASII